jgi:hypothetical protein
MANTNESGFFSAARCSSGIVIAKRRLIDIAQQWLELAEYAERDLGKHYLRRRTIEAVIG